MYDMLNSAPCVTKNVAYLFTCRPNRACNEGPEQVQEDEKQNDNDKKVSNFSMLFIIELPSLGKFANSAETISKARRTSETQTCCDCRTLVIADMAHGA